MSSPSEDEASTAGKALLARWLTELEEFLLMVRSAQHGFKKVAGGGDRWDRDLYDEEANECRRNRKVLEQLEFPESVSAEQARAVALKALEEERARAEAAGRPPKAPYEWARAVVEGDASQHWNTYHPRRRQTSPAS